LQWVALTTTILAVAAAIPSLRASSYSTRVQIHTTKEANQWAFFQSKSIKEHNFRMTRDLLMATALQPNHDSKAKDFVQAKIKEFDDEIGRYEKEKQEIKEEAENLIREQQTLKEHNSAFATAVMLLQIAIMMSAVAALVRRKSMWYLGVTLGLVGLIYMGNGFFLWL
jgi:FtsZ-binding cell division protein ZapB